MLPDLHRRPPSAPLDALTLGAAVSRAEQKRRTREAILASAGTLLRTRGIAESTVGEVMQAAGLTVGGFYGHFDSKEELFVEAIRCAAAAGRQRMEAVAHVSPDRVGALNAVAAYLSPAHRDDVAGGCPLPNPVAEVARAGEPYRAALAEVYDSFVVPLAEMLGGSDASRKEALGLLSTMYGALSLSRAVAGTPLSDEILTAALDQAERVLAERRLQLPGNTP